MCFTLLRSTSCALIQIDNLLLNLHCVISLILGNLLSSSVSTCLNNPVATVFDFLSPFVSGTSLDLIPFFRPLFTLNTLQGNRNAASDNTGQSQCRFYWKITILQVGVKPGQLVAVHEFLGMAKVWQRISMVTQIGQRVSMVVCTFHHGV